MRHFKTNDKIYIKNDFANAAEADAFETPIAKKYIPMTKKRMMEIILRGLPSGINVQMQLESDGIGDISIMSPFLNDIGREFYLQSGILEAGNIKVADAMQGQGLGRKLIRNYINFFSECGVRQFNMCAAGGNGGYTWARFGFLPDITFPEKSSYIRSHFHEVAETNYLIVSKLLTDKEKQSFEELLDFKSPRYIWRIADNRIDLAERFREKFGKSECVRKADPELIKILKSSLERGTPMPLGRAVLTGTSWDGSIDFGNQEQMARVDSYVGGLGDKQQTGANSGTLIKTAAHCLK